MSYLIGMAEGGYIKTVEKVAEAINKLGLPMIAAAVAIVTAGMLWLPDKLLLLFENLM